MEAKAYYGPDNVRILATKNGDDFDIIYLGGMIPGRMTAEELAEFKRQGTWRRYGNGEDAKILREVNGDRVVYHMATNPAILIEVSRDEWAKLLSK